MARLRLVVWNDAEAKARAALLREAGHRVNTAPMDGDALRRLRHRPPEGVVIDLDRLPSQGRDVGMALRTSRATRGVPIVFVGGAPEKVARARRQLPDAVYTTWPKAARDLDRALRNPPTKPHVPASNLAGYSGTPLPQKLGIAPGMKVSLVNAPRSFLRTLGAPIDDVRFSERAAKCDLAIWFVTAEKELERRIARLSSLADRGGLWICWPKRTSGMTSDLSENAIRRIGLDSGLVDYKICAIDETWSGLKFTHRKKR